MSHFFKIAMFLNFEFPKCSKIIGHNCTVDGVRKAIRELLMF